MKRKRLDSQQMNKFCFRHRPENQNPSLSFPFLSTTDKESFDQLEEVDKQQLNSFIQHFSNSSNDIRKLYLSSILNLSCFPQLSFISNQLPSLLRVDLLTNVPEEISIKILSFLDAKSLCRAAQVCKKWRILCDDDVLWHRMCEQHIEKRCTKCGWGLPLMHNKPSVRFTCQPQSLTKPVVPMPSASSSSLLLNRRSWKQIYSERLQVERNWRTNRHVVKAFPTPSPVHSLQFDQNIIINGCLNGQLFIFDVRSGELLHQIMAHEQMISCLQFDECKIITGSFDKKIKVWNLFSGECIKVLERHQEAVTCLNFNEKVLASGSLDHSIRIWNYKESESFSLQGHAAAINQVKLYQQDFLFSASDDQTMKMWNWKTRELVRTFQGHQDAVLCLQPSFVTSHLHHDFILTGSADNTIRKWDIQTGEEIECLFGHLDGVFALDCNQLRLMSAGLDGMILVHDIQDKKMMYKILLRTAFHCLKVSDTKICVGTENEGILMLDYCPQATMSQ